MKLIILLDSGDSGPYLGQCMPLHEYMDSQIVGGTNLDDLYRIQLMAVDTIVLNYDGGLDVMRIR